MKEMKLTNEQIKTIALAIEEEAWKRDFNISREGLFVTGGYVEFTNPYLIVEFTIHGSYSGEYQIAPDWSGWEWTDIDALYLDTLTAADDNDDLVLPQSDIEAIMYACGIENRPHININK